MVCFFARRSQSIKIGTNQVIFKAGLHWRRSWSRKSASDLVKIENRSRKQKRKNQPITMPCLRNGHFDWFILQASAYDSDNLVFTGS